MMTPLDNSTTSNCALRRVRDAMGMTGSSGGWVVLGGDCSECLLCLWSAELEDVDGFDFKLFLLALVVSCKLRRVMRRTDGSVADGEEGD